MNSPVRLSRFTRDKSRQIGVSFEFFPPRDASAQASLCQAVERLAPLDPRFVSVTYGAGGGTRAQTCASVARIQRDTGLKAAAHLTCLAASCDEVDAVEAFLVSPVERLDEGARISWAIGLLPKSSESDCSAQLPAESALFAR